MHTYVTVSFWLGITSVAIRILVMACRDDWPHKESTNLGTYAAGTILHLGFVIWAGLALWVLK